MTDQTSYDVEAVDALAEALADAEGTGDVFRAEPADQIEYAPTRLVYILRAQSLLLATRASGYELVRGGR